MKMQNMISRKLLAVALLMLLISAGTASAQLNWTGGLHFNAGFPQGEFKDQIDRNAYGLGGQFFYSPGQSPFGLGVELGWMNYGNESRREPFSTTIPDVTVRVETSNNIVQGFLIFRTQMPTGAIRPYGAALVGFNYLFTETKITDSDDPSEDVASSTNQDDAAFAYGFGGGLMVQLYDGTKRDSKQFQVLLDGGLRYVLGGEAQYLKKGSIRRENGTVTYDLLQSKTDLLRLHVGVMFRF